jgi:hypothetical protein
MKNAIYLIIICLLFYSCGFIRLLNTSEEKDENSYEIDKFLKKHNYLYDFSFQSIDSLNYLKKSETYKINLMNNKVEYIQLRVFDSIGRLYTGFSQCMGDFNKKVIIDSFPPKKNTYPFLNNNLNFQNELKLIDASESVKNEVREISSKTSYTFVVYYTIWTNYFSKHVLKEVSKIKAKYKNRVLILFVNTAKNKDK